MLTTTSIELGQGHLFHHELSDRLEYKEEPVQILDRKTKQLRNRQIPLVKILWNNHGVEEATWETEDAMRRQYPYLFGSDQGNKNFEDEISF